MFLCFNLKISDIFFVLGIYYYVMTDYELTDLEKKALQTVNEEKEVYQNNLADYIDCSSGHASKIARKLIDKKLINRKKGENNKYVLYPTKKDPKDLDFSLLMAGDMLSPLIGEDEIDIYGDRFTNWLMNLTHEENKR